MGILERIPNGVNAQPTCGGGLFSFSTRYLISSLIVIAFVFLGTSAADTIVPPDASADVHPEPFVHPGMLHSTEDLERIRNHVRAGDEPWTTAWQAFLKIRLIDKRYTPRPLPTAGRDKTTNVGQQQLANDMSAAYYNAIVWSITGDEAYARKSVEIMNAWSYKNTAIIGSDAILAAGIYGYKVANAAEIIRATYPAWQKQDVEQMQRWLRTVWYPVIKDLADANWGTCCIPTILSIGVFCDDHVIFTNGVYAYEYGGAGKDLCGVAQYISKTGQSGEAGRDQPHAQGGIGHLAEAAQIAWNQGIDLYSFDEDRLLAGFEYAAKYNLGEDVPYDPQFHRGTMGPWKTISAKGRGDFSPIYEMVWNHYVVLKNLAAPYTEAVARKYRPEGTNVDHPGAGTLMFTLDRNVRSGE
jgi:hypothetical protein